MENSETKTIETNNKIYLSNPNSGLEDITFVENYLEVNSKKLKYFVWLARFCVLLAGASLFIMVMNVMVLFKSAPKVTVEPFLMIEQDTSKGIVRNEPITHDMASKEQLMEIFIKYYVTLRNTIISDRREMQTRWYPGGMIHLLSVPGIFDEFNEYRKNVWDDLFYDDMSQEVEIISINRVWGSKSPVWKVDFKTYQMSPGDRDPLTKAVVVNTRYWTTSITAYFVPERMFVSLRLINPLGFSVFRYSQTEVEIL